MATDNMTRWTVMVSKDTDIALRSFLAQRGLKKAICPVSLKKP